MRYEGITSSEPISVPADSRVLSTDSCFAYFTSSVLPHSDPFRSQTCSDLPHAAHGSRIFHAIPTYSFLFLANPTRILLTSNKYPFAPTLLSLGGRPCGWRCRFSSMTLMEKFTGRPTWWGEHHPILCTIPVHILSQSVVFQCTLMHLP